MFILFELLIYFQLLLHQMHRKILTEKTTRDFFSNPLTIIFNYSSNFLYRDFSFEKISFQILYGIESTYDRSAGLTTDCRQYNIFLFQLHFHQHNYRFLRKHHISYINIAKIFINIKCIYFLINLIYSNNCGCIASLFICLTFQTSFIAL